jgi:acyl-CoA synthetase (AMP-forming)/AMP-acid ligase II
MLNLELHTGVAVVDSADGRHLSCAQLCEAGQARLAHLTTRGLVMLFADMTLATIETYLGALSAGHAIALLDARMQSSFKAGLIDAYRPATVVGPPGLGLELNAAGVDLRCVSAGADVEVFRPAVDGAVTLHADLAVLLATSGTTGAPKFVRLSRRNVEANADSIARYLGLNPEERAISSLPLHYSYGLSVLNSHLWAGGRFVLTGASLVQPPFWDAFQANGCTSLAGVPFSYQVLERIGFRTQSPRTLRTMTQAGGPLDQPVAAIYSRHLRERGGRFFVMYGQTEATARMAYVPPDRLLEKSGSAGVAIPGGRLLIDAGGGPSLVRGVTGEVVYQGANVMLGYAEGADDLDKGDELCGELRTGDLGYLDDHGYLFLVGRSKRIAKIHGVRVNLDDVERQLRQHGPAAALAGSDAIVAACAFGDEQHLRALARQVARQLGVNHKSIRLTRVDAIAVTTSGKTDYKRVEQWLLT